MSITSPYENLERRAFWRTGVSQSESFPPNDLYRPKFAIDSDTKILTAGSCFAQHVGRALNKNGFSVIDTEAMPESCPEELQRKYGYGLYSARYGNLYSIRQFLQLIKEAYGLFTPAEPIWPREGRFYDALRPSIEPNGYETADHVRRARRSHLTAVKRALEESELVIFTLGLTETWEHIESGTVYPTAPGTIAHSMDPDVFCFRNFRTQDIYNDFAEIHSILKEKSPGVKFLLTVSPVPLTATATNNHVLSATVYSKSVLRAVCGELYEDFEDVDYFPSYEIAASHPSKSEFFEKNMRLVTSTGVEKIMRYFIESHLDGTDTADSQELNDTAQEPQDGEQDDAVCEDILLEAFQK